MAAVLLYVLFVVVGLRFFGAAEVGAVLSAISLIWFAALWRREGSLRATFVPSAAFVIGLGVWLAESATILQLLPVIVSSLFFVKFLDAAWRKKPFLAVMVQRVPKVKWSDSKLEYIDRSHGYWAVVTGINTAIQAVMVMAPTTLWALYTTLGWYLLFAVALGVQIVYGKLHAV
jgi:hypothetical protein